MAASASSVPLRDGAPTPSLQRPSTPDHSRHRSIRNRAETTRDLHFSTGQRPAAPTWRIAIETTVILANGLHPLSCCPFTGTMRMGCDGAHNLPRAEVTLKRINVWALAYRLVPRNGGTRDQWKVWPQNLFQCSKILHAYLKDGPERRILILPIEDHITAIIRRAEAEAAQCEDDVRGRESRGEDTSKWYFPLDKVFEDDGWPHKLSLSAEVAEASPCVPPGGLKLYEYELLVFDDPSLAAVYASMLTRCDLYTGAVKSPTPTGSQVLPLEFKEGPPRAWLPLSLVHVLLMSLAHIRHIRQRHPSLRFPAWFVQRCNFGDYLLSICESKHPSSWRKFRPADLPFDPPHPERLYEQGPCWTARRQYEGRGEGEDEGEGEGEGEDRPGSVGEAEESDRDDGRHGPGSDGPEESREDLSEEQGTCNRDSEVPGTAFFDSDSEADSSRDWSPDTSLTGMDEGVEDDDEVRRRRVALADACEGYAAEEEALIQQIRDDEDEDASVAKSVRMAPFHEDDRVEALQAVERLFLAATKEEEARAALEEEEQRREEGEQRRWHSGSSGQVQAQAAF